MKCPLIISLIFLILLSCSGDGEVIASMNTGVITRLEFNEWLENRNISLKAVYEDKQVLNGYLRSLAAEKLTYEKALVAEYDKKKSYIRVENSIYKNLLAEYYREKLQKRITFTEKASEISIIRIFLHKKDPEERKIEEINKKELIQFIISELNRGINFGYLARKYSEDISSSEKGFMGIVPECVMDDSFRNSLLNLNDGGFTDKPIEINRSLTLVKLHKKHVLNEENIFNAVKDRSISEKVIYYHTNKIIGAIAADAFKSMKVISNIDKISFIRNREIIFSINDEVFTVKDLNELLKIFYRLKSEELFFKEFSISDKRELSRKILEEYLVAVEAEKKLFEKDHFFVKKWFYLKRAALAGSFKYTQLMKSVVIREKDIRKEYLTNFKSARSENSFKDSGVKTPLSYRSVRTSIKNMIIFEELKLMKEKWNNDILNEFNFKVNNPEFSVY